jgi:integrase
VASLKLPKVKFHALRHTHASALIAAGLDVVTVSKQLGHSSPKVTLDTYSHLFERTSTAAADAIAAAMRGGAN